LTPAPEPAIFAPEHFGHDVRKQDEYMAGGSMAGSVAGWRERLSIAVRRTFELVCAVLLLLFVLAASLSLLSYETGDPSMNTAAAGPAVNLLGIPGAWTADILLSLFGPVVLIVLIFPLLSAIRLGRGIPVEGWVRDLLLVCLAAFLIGTALSILKPDAVAGLPAGVGGGIGLLLGSGMNKAIVLIPADQWLWPVRIAVAALAIVAGLVIWLYALRLDQVERAWLKRRLRRSPAAASGDVSIADDAALAPKRSRRQAAERVPFDIDDDGPVVGDGPRRPVIAEPSRPRAEPQRPRERQTKLDLRDTYQLPALDLLTPPPVASGPAIDKAALERNARLLETVLEDFHVKGRIVEVRPGPVVTMYELEPAAGIKASRVIQLADDIARNMSALSARVATIPGRTVIGIELPNAKREAVSFSEMIASETFEEAPGALPLILGKNIGGDPVIADLAPMPHLLVAGTTGSGKSVGLNSMILSLLYKLTPEQCRMIMIDPKMLELSIYDDIPHLLSPVVTEPAKAIRALKWAVEQMEERYRMMASVGVRSLASFNEKVRVAKAKGQPLGRRVQTGYDAETGQPIYEEEQLDCEVLPQIVVIVDELADLMMTAGKEVEFLIQRLAQKARAAGIHLIMATQRPSVDVITGVIKANLPTRISFAVTSKIDSRTILGEQGAEQLLGKGDMLYMPGGKQTVRVHGPFVSDEEVRAVADHWRTQGVPDYIQAVTEEPEDGGWAMEGAPTGPDDPETQLYLKAVQLVVENRKASTSWLQRQLRVGYNSAARLIERMEKAEIISAPDHVGRREVQVEVADLSRLLGGR